MNKNIAMFLLNFPPKFWICCKFLLLLANTPKCKKWRITKSELRIRTSHCHCWNFSTTGELHSEGSLVVMEQFHLQNLKLEVDYTEFLFIVVIVPKNRRRPDIWCGLFLMESLTSVGNPPFKTRLWEESWHLST